MRTFTILFSAFVLGTTAHAQTVATFDDLSLATTDTFYVNYSASGTDVGFNDGLARFPCIYDTSYGGTWTTGFAYSNMTDSVTSGYFNEYSAKAAKGYAGSDNYAVAHVSDPVTYAPDILMPLTGAAIGHPVSGFYVTNGTYAYNSMRDGDMFARKFHNGDWFKLTIQGYLGGTLQPDSVGVYLANFLFPDTTMNYILKTWQWVNLLSLGNVDSLQFTLSSTDNGFYGMNTPAYFCMDNFTTAESSGLSSLSANNIQSIAVAKVYPNPATNTLYVDIADNSVQQVNLVDMAGNIISTYSAVTKLVEINTASLPVGMYVLQMMGNGNVASMKFVKE